MNPNSSTTSILRDLEESPELFKAASNQETAEQNPSESESSIDSPLESHPTVVPVLTFGVPVRNSEDTICRLLDSLLAQDFQDFEIVICDNQSTDRTPEICREYAERDSRIHFFINSENIGTNQNFNRVLELAQGKFFRWIGSDDWLEPDYVSKCLEMFEQRPDAFGVTTYQDHTDDEGVRHYCEFPDRRPDSPSAYERFRRMAWFMNADYRYIDPIYTMVRRETLLKTHRLNLNVVWADQVLGAEMSLHGSFAHVPLCLAHRRITPPSPWQKCLQRWYNNYYDKVRYQTCLNVAAIMIKMVLEYPMPVGEKLLCIFPIMRYLFARISSNLLAGFKEATRPIRKPLKFFIVKYLRPVS